MDKLGRRELNKEKCRYRILKAARQLFSSKGYENTTISDVAERAEISKATLYNYFPGKENLLTGIIEAELTEINKLISTELRQEPRSLEKLRRVLRALVLDSSKYSTLSRKITYLNACNDSEMFATRAKMIEILHTLILEAQKNNELRPECNPGELVDLIMGIYLVSQFQWPGIDEQTRDFYSEKIDRYFDKVIFADIRREPEGIL